MQRRTRSSKEHRGSPCDGSEIRWSSLLPYLAITEKGSCDRTECLRYDVGKVVLDFTSETSITEAKKKHYGKSRLYAVGFKLL